MAHAKLPAHLLPSHQTSPGPSVRTEHSHKAAITPQAQHYTVTPTVESLDNEQLIQIDSDAADLFLHRSSPAADGEEDELLPGGPRSESVDYKHARAQSIMAKSWWRRPSPTWLLMIAVGHSISMGMGIAPKAEIYNSLACLVHYPSTSSEAPVHSSDPASPDFPVVPRPLPPGTSDAEDEAQQDAFSSYLNGSNLSARSVFDVSTDGPDGASAPTRIDPKLCRRNPQVQAAAARFSTAMTITQGVLSTLTTGIWGRASDRWGRTKVMAFAMFGIIVNDIVFLTTAKFPHIVPGGYRFLIVGPFIDGLLGGSPTIGATNNAYIADCTPDGTRAQIYVRFGGIFMLGFAVGPVLGALVIKHFGDVLSVFYVSTFTHVLFFFVVLFLLPESLSSEAKTFLSTLVKNKKAEQAEREAAERAWEDESPDVGQSGWSRISGTGMRKTQGTFRRAARSAFSFLTPLDIFAPRLDPKTGKRDWNLTKLAIGNGCIQLMFGVFAQKFAYMQMAFGWGPTELGPYISLIGIVRASHLLVILPAILRHFQPKELKAKQPRAGSVHEGIDGAATPASSTAPTRAILGSHFDLKIVKTSLLIDIAGYIGIILSTGPQFFMAATCLTTLGGGAGPAISSLALALLPSTRMSGRLFGGMAVLQACVATVIGPLIFGITYSLTTAVFPKAVFCIALALLFGAITAFSTLRLGPRPSELEDAAAAEEEQEQERGRDRRARKLNSSGFSIQSSVPSSAAPSH